MSLVVGILVLIVGVVVSVALHEVGHMVPAKKFGVRVSQYMVGFGPTLWSKTRGETEYGFKAIPAGGYVRMVGMYPPGNGRRGNGFFGQIVDEAREASVEEIRPGEEHRAFYNLSTPKKLIVMLGGPTMNLLLAFVLVAIAACGIGQITAGTKVAEVAQCQLPADATTTECAAGDPTSPAKAAGLQQGDTIKSIDGTAVTNDWEGMRSALDAAMGKTVPMVVERDGADVTLMVTPTVRETPVTTANGAVKKDADGNTVNAARGYLGVTPYEERQRVSVGDAAQSVWDQVSGTAKLIVTLPVKVADTAVATFTGKERSADSPASVVGVGQIAVAVAGADTEVLNKVAVMLELLAALNIALFVFNLIPLLPLDGGHVVNALYEGAKRQIARVRGLPRPGPADLARMMPVAYVMFFVLIGVGSLLIIADIVDPIKLT